MDPKEERLKRIISQNTPFHRQKDLVPRPGGKSLLHDENGMPQFKTRGPVTPNNAQQVAEKQSERVKIKATNQEAHQVRRPLVNRELNPTHTAQGTTQAQERYDPSTLLVDMPVHVGNHEEHGWFDEKVTGAPVDQGMADVPEHNRFIDNDQYVNTDALQGAQRLPLSDSDREFLERQQAESAWNESNPPRSVAEDILNGIAEGEMCVLIKGDPVYSSNSREEIVACIEDAMMKYEVPIADIKVIKRLGLDFGLTMG